MRRFKKNYKKLLTFILFVLSLGMFLGFTTFDNVYAKKAKGDVSSTVTDNKKTNATTSNATTSNATTSNATTSNATTPNATDPNVIKNDNILSLYDFTFKSNNGKAGDKIEINIVIYGACNSGASITMENENGDSFTETVQSLNKSPYIVIPDTVKPSTTYKLKELLLVGTNSDGSTFTKLVDLTQGNYSKDYITVAATVIENPITLSKISLPSTVKIGEQINVELTASETVISATLTFKNAANQSFEVKMGSNKTITIPSTVTAGNYYLSEIILKSNNNSGTIAKDSLPNEVNITVNDDSTAFVYDNNDINDEIIKKIQEAQTGTKITITTDKKSIVSEKIFDAIKGSDKDLVIKYNDNQIIFNGKSITKSSTIDAKVEAKVIDSSSDISKLIPKGVLIIFPDNGVLPGEATVRIKATDELDKVLKEKGYIYFYNEDTKDFCEIDSLVYKANGYYEFNVVHNSRYVIVNELLDDSLVANPSTTVTFQKSNKINILLIVAGAVLVLGATALIVFLKKKKKKENKEVKAETENENNKNE